MGNAGDGLDARVSVPSRHDPYRYWSTGILVELGVFAAFSAIIIGTTIVLALVLGG